MNEMMLEPMPIETALDRQYQARSMNHSYFSLSNTIGFLVVIFILGTMVFVFYFGNHIIHTPYPIRPTSSFLFSLTNSSEMDNNDISMTDSLLTTRLLNEIKVVWLMSFPNSGTSFTSKLIRHVTKLSTATNYGNEIASLKSIASIWNESVLMGPNETLIPKPPYWIDPHSLGTNWSRPTRLVLTKTHCGGRCEWCGPAEYIENPHSFRMQCHAGQWNKDPTRIMYPLDRVVKAIHLIRNPMDNVVSRFHLGRKLFAARGLEFSSGRDGFVKFCQVWKVTYGPQEAKIHWLDPQVYRILEHVPCFGDFIRYVQWHNLALIVTQDLRLPTMVLRYEDFEFKLDETIHRLTTFLETPRRGEMIEFSRGKKYLEYFTVEERLAIANGVKQMSLWATWQHIQHYFE
jgi:Sulfotransferase domain